MIQARRACAEWPRVLCPAPGFMPPVVPMRCDERVLHVAMRTINDRQDGLTRALRSCATLYRDIEWRLCASATSHPHFSDVLTPLCESLVRTASDIAPTIVWMQLHGPDIVTARDIDRLRAVCARNVVIINWDGDQHYEPDHPARAWFVELGRACDASLLVNTRYPHRYAELGVRRPGFWGVGFDELVWRPTDPTPGTPPVVALANYWQHVADAYAGRTALFGAAARAFHDRFAVYGGGWSQCLGVPWRPYLRNDEEAGVYSAARAALSISIRNDLDRYTSNRLVYMLGSGAVPVVEDFADSAGFGLVDGENALLFRGRDEMVSKLRWAVDEANEAERQRIRDGAYALGQLHTWDAHIPELLAIVDACRGVTTC